MLRTLERLNIEQDKSFQISLGTNRYPLFNHAHLPSVLFKCDGIILLCQIMYDDSYSFGNLLLDTSSMIVKKHLKLSEIVQQREIPDDKCAKCLSHVQFHKGYMALAMIKNKNATADDCECDFRKLQLLGYEKQLSELH